MRLVFLTTAVILVSCLCVSGQDSGSTPGHTDNDITETPPLSPENSPPASPPVSEGETDATDSSTQVERSARDWGLTASGYERPDPNRRLKSFLNDVAGPFALARYAGTAGLLTGRDSPSEWGNRWDGYGRRFGNAVGKGIVRKSVIYGLDEALKVDSHFYRSRNRSVSARLRNSLFSAVTARGRSGKRVIGVPRIVGGFTAEIVSSKTWYPDRFNYLHGVKGGLIDIGINAGFNLLREFVWK